MGTEKQTSLDVDQIDLAMKFYISMGMSLLPADEGKWQIKERSIS